MLLRCEPGAGGWGGAEERDRPAPVRLGRPAWHQSDARALGAGERGALLCNENRVLPGVLRWHLRPGPGTPPCAFISSCAHCLPLSCPSKSLLRPLCSVWNQTRRTSRGSPGPAVLPTNPWKGALGGDPGIPLLPDVLRPRAACRKLLEDSDPGSLGWAVVWSSLVSCGGAGL